MRISRRTSGGRGEYEISEVSSEGFMPIDIVDRRIKVDLGDGIIFDTGTLLGHVQGKFRIRLIRPDANMQLHRQVVAALLLPDAVRANDPMGGGEPIIRKGRYAIQTIGIGKVHRTERDVTLSVSAIEISNRDHAAEQVNVRERVEGVRRLWEECARLPEELQTLLQRHRDAVAGGGPLRRDLGQLMSSLQSVLSDQATDLSIVYNEYSDCLPPLLELLEPQMAEPSFRVEDVEPEEVELKRRTIREWRKWVAHRGTASAQFRKRVREGYRSTCLVCGKCFPPTRHNRVPGVDAAHILPWADYDLDLIGNGLCLCKLCHWAFDEGIILIQYSERGYSMHVSPTAQQIITESRPDFSLDVFERLSGPIPAVRLPQGRRDWPNPQFLAALLHAQEG